MGSGQWSATPGLRSLKGIQVDVTARLGTVEDFVASGLTLLDSTLQGGLRRGDLMVVSGEPGCGKTALALLMAYMAARAKVGTIFTSVLLEDTEVVARLAARALYREYKNANASFGSIWSGQAWQDSALRAPVSSSVEQVIRKVGQHLHLHRGKPLEPMTQISAMAGILSQRHERVLVVVDGIEGLSAEAKGANRDAINANLQTRWLQVALELRALASNGCMVFATCQDLAAPYVAPAATVFARLERGTSAAATSSATAKPEQLDSRLMLQKNRSGPSALIPLKFIPSASLFEDA